MPMSDEDKQFHLYAGWHAGYARTCGKKVDYKSEETAAKSAIKLTEKYGRSMEAYPCYFCQGWHVGGTFQRGVLNGS